MPASAVRFAVTSIALLLLVSPLCAQSGREGRGRSGPGTGNPDEHLVPWKFLPRNGGLIKAPLVLYWLPASEAEMKRSPLLTSRDLVDAGGRCVGLEIVMPDDVATIDQLGATGKLPMAVLVDDQGAILHSAGSSLSAVEQMLSGELSSRDHAVFLALTDAKTAARGGEKEKAVALYTKIWNDRCLYPLLGSEAQRGLKELGVIVRETPAPPPADPNLKVTAPSTKKHRPAASQPD